VSYHIILNLLRC